MSGADDLHGTRLKLGAEVWRHRGGTVLVGGAPTRVLRLEPRAAALIDRGMLEVDDEDSARLAARLRDAGVAHPDPLSLPEIALTELTVVIPVHGRVASLARVLDGLRGVRVIVVDDGTPAPDDAALRATVHAAGAELVRLDENLGPASARNAGLARASTPFVALIDSDVQASPADLALLLRHFADPGLAAVAPRIVGTGRGGTWIERYENARSSVDLGRRAALVRPRSPVAWVSTTCLVVRREAVSFTAGMRVAEDVDLVWRLCAEGWRVRFEPAVEVAHAHRRTVSAWFGRKLFYGTGAADLAERHPRAIPPAILRPWSLAVVAAVVVGRPWSLATAGGVVLVAGARLHRSIGPAASIPLVMRLMFGGVVSALTQASALALRHWWPLAVLVALIVPRTRGMLLVAGVVDAAVEYVRLRPRLDPLRFLLARRLDDLAYGTGLWLGCIRRRRFRALRIELRTPR